MINKYKHNLKELDINQLFVEHKIDEIVEIEKLLDAEIERKRSELRSMVGDRYKDILIASDSIKNMKTISTKIVESIQNIGESCDTLLENADSTEEKSSVRSDEEKINERILVVQIRLSIFINEAIWMHLDEENYLDAAQLYLLGQNIHTGLNFLNSAIIHKVPLLKHVKLSLVTLKDIILERIIAKLESVELTSEQACSNLNGLMLLQNRNTDQLISIFMEHRKTALTTVINIFHSSVRLQISAMVKCLITTIHLFYDCFMCSDSSKSGLIFKQLEEILSDNSEPTICKLKMSSSPLDVYIPTIVREFRPKCKIPTSDEQSSSNEKLIEKWLEDTKETVKLGLSKSLEKVTTIKGLHIIREEALKIESPINWEHICEAVNLPKNFNVWYYFFQTLITDRAKVLVGSKVRNNMESFIKDVKKSLKNSGKSNIDEMDLRSYIWTEDVKDIGKFNTHSGISMKAMGFSQTIVILCKHLDEMFLELLNDMSQYLYGEAFDGKLETVSAVVKDTGYRKKFVDLDVLQKCLVHYCVLVSSELLQILTSVLPAQIDDEKVKKTVFCIRLLQAITKLCPYFKKCCSITNIMEDWHKICESFNKCCTELWKIWIDHSVERTKKFCTENFKNLECATSLSLFFKWDSIEIQEQTEEKVFKSQIRVPLKPSTALENILAKLNENLCCILPQTLPKSIHVKFIENNAEVILNRYGELVSHDFNQNQALQFLFDVKFLTLFCITRENERLIDISQGICDKFRSKIDPFDLDVFYSYLQTNVKRAVVQCQVIMGCLLPSHMQIANLEISERSKEHEKEPSILAVSNPSTNAWFPLLPITAPSNKHFVQFPVKEEKTVPTKPPLKTHQKKTVENTSSSVRAASLFGGLTSDWFS